MPILRRPTVFRLASLALLVALRSVALAACGVTGTMDDVTYSWPCQQNFSGGINLLGASTLGYCWTATDTLGNGSWQMCASGGGAAHAPPGSVQFNTAGAFDGDANFTFNSATDRLTITGSLKLFGGATKQIPFVDVGANAGVLAVDSQWFYDATSNTMTLDGTIDNLNKLRMDNPDIISDGLTNRGFFFESGDQSASLLNHTLRAVVDGSRFAFKSGAWLLRQQRNQGFYLHYGGNCSGNCQTGPFQFGDLAWMQEGTPSQLARIGASDHDNDRGPMFGYYNGNGNSQYDDFLWPAWSIRVQAAEYRAVSESITNEDGVPVTWSAETKQAYVPDPPQRSGWSIPSLGAFVTCNNAISRRTCDGAGAGNGAANNRGLTATGGNESSWIPWNGVIGGCSGSTSTNRANEACENPATHPENNERVFINYDFESYTAGNHMRPFADILAVRHAVDSGGACDGSCLDGAHSLASPAVIVDFPAADTSGTFGYKKLFTPQKFCWHGTPGPGLGALDSATELVCSGTTTVCASNADCTTPATCNLVRKHCAVVGDCSAGDVCEIAPPGADVFNVYVTEPEAQTTTAPQTQFVRRNRVPVNCSTDAQCEGDAGSCAGGDGVAGLPDPGKCIRTWIRFDGWQESLQPVLVNQTSESYAAAFGPDGSPFSNAVSPAFGVKRQTGHKDALWIGALAGLSPTVNFWDETASRGFARLVPTVDGAFGGTITHKVHKPTALNDSPTGDVTTLTESADATGPLVAIGGGTNIRKHLSGSATIDFGAIATTVCADVDNAAAAATITVTGAAAGDTVYLGVPTAAAVAGSQFSAWVSGANTVTVRHCCIPAAGCNPGSGSFRADVWQH